jgi:ribosome recycling factor
MIEDIKKDLKQRMQKSLDALKHDMSKLRTGRAHPSLLQDLKVPYYGTDTPLNQVATVNVSDAQTLAVTPWEKNMIPAIEKAIHAADLGLNPVTSGDMVRVPLPPLTEERRKDLTKLVKQEGENARVAVRNIRRDANQQIKDLLKEKMITEDEQKDYEDQVQKMTDKFVQNIDEQVKHKEKELMEI